MNLLQRVSSAFIISSSLSLLPTEALSQQSLFDAIIPTVKIPAHNVFSALEIFSKNYQFDKESKHPDNPSTVVIHYVEHMSSAISTGCSSLTLSYDASKRELDQYDIAKRTNLFPLLKHPYLKEATIITRDEGGTTKTVYKRIGNYDFTKIDSTLKESQFPRACSDPQNIISASYKTPQPSAR